MLAAFVLFANGVQSAGAAAVDAAVESALAGSGR